MRLLKAVRFGARFLFLSTHALLKPRQLNWYESPGHQLLEMLGSISHSRQSSNSHSQWQRGLFRRFYVEISALRKFRELIHGDGFITEFRVSEEGLSKFPLTSGLLNWYVGRYQADAIRVGFHPLHTTVFVKGRGRPVMDLFALMMCSGAHSNISYVWSGPRNPFRYRERLSQPVGNSPDVEFDTAYDIAVDDPIARANAETHGLSLSRFEIQSEGWRRANDLMKAVAPGAMMVAVSLPLDELGFCDRALKERIPVFARLHRSNPWLRFCLLDRTTMDVGDSVSLMEAGIIPVRSRGLNYMAAIAMMQHSAFYLGDLTDFGLLAVSSGKPGLYFDPIRGDKFVELKKQWHLVNPDEDAIESVVSTLAQFSLTSRQLAWSSARRSTTEPTEMDEETKCAGPNESKESGQANWGSSCKLTSSDALEPSGKSNEQFRAITQITKGWEERVARSKWSIPHERRRTVTLYIDVFGYCNLRCPSCPVGNWPKDGEKAFTTGLIEEETFRAIIEKALAEANVSSVGLFNWTEPLLNPNINSLIRIVKSYGLTCSISSNLNVLKDPVGLLDSGIDWLRVSLSGFTQEIYGHYHKNGDIERVKTNMRRLADARDQIGVATDIEVFFHKYVDNGDDEIMMKTYAEELGFRFVDAWAYLMPVEKMLAVAEPGRRDGKGLTENDRMLIDRLALSPDEALRVSRAKRRKGCELYNYLTIDIRGNIFLCCAASGRPENLIANYLEEGLDEIYKKQLRHSLCGSCMKNGLPELYGHAHAEFEEIGKRGRSAWELANERANDTQGDCASKLEA